MGRPWSERKYWLDWNFVSKPAASSAYNNDR
jgi:hypothetical protein